MPRANLDNRKLPISVIMVIHNEEPVIERALASCADIVSEIIVVHGGPCKDASLDICLRYTSKIFVREFLGDPGEHRVFALNQAKHNWVFLLDADEFFSEGLRKRLPELITDSRYQGYEFLWPTWYKGKYFAVYHKRTLVDKRYFYLIGLGSEYFKPIHPGIRVRRLTARLEHKPTYDNLTFRIFRKKWLRWARLRGRVLSQPFTSLEKYNCPLKDWEPKTRYRLQHPLTLGLFGSFIVHNILGISTFIRTGRWLMLKSGFLMSLYHTALYFYVWKEQHAKPMSGRGPAYTGKNR